MSFLLVGIPSSWLSYTKIVQRVPSTNEWNIFRYGQPNNALDHDESKDYAKIKITCRHGADW
jgi:hypothetical protein